MEPPLREPTSDPIAFAMGARLPRVFAGRRVRRFVTVRFQIDTRRQELSRLCSSCPIPGTPIDKKDFYMRRKRARDSTNGRFITLDEARQRPRETVIETVKKPCPEKKPSR
ncbi:competence protein CinA [Pseudomonas sp. RIT412]|nr:competence protein CinA [Pseudomonas sp. RIT 409]RAU55855.1 competence protein CinA [Pseudomonas sp. RIT 412]